MTTRRCATLVIGIGAVVLIGRPAHAEPSASIQVVGGFEEFYDYGMRHATRAAGLWGVRASVAIAQHLQLEAAYLGSAGQLNAPLSHQEATLVGNTVEVVGRVPLFTGPAQPYAFFGVSWRHYEVTGADFMPATAGMNDSDDVIQVPMGAGIAYHRGELVVDARVVFRATGGETFLVEDDDWAAMDSWGLQGALGYRF